MINKFNRIISLLPIFLLFTLSFHCTIAFAATKQEKHVLIMNPYTQDYPGTQLYIQGIKNSLEKNSEYKFSYSYEYVDLARHSNDDKYLEDTAKYFKLKYLKDQPNFILTTVFMNSLFSKYGNDMFPNVPVIIDWNEDNQSIMSMPSNYVIVPRRTEIDQNIQVILKTKPLTKKIYMVVGDSAGERNLSKRILEAKNKYDRQVELVLLNKLPYEEMLKVIKSAEDNSAVLFFQWFSDVKGKSFVPAQVIETICKEAKVPVYGISMNYMGTGVIGGYVGNQELVGETAGGVVLDILRGKKPLDMSVVRALSRTYTFDWRQLKRWRIEEDKLPSDSIIEYREKSVWELYRGYIVVALALIIVQTVSIFLLLLNRRERRKAETELIQANISLQGMTEKLISIDKMKDEFLVTTSHELQTPLNGIINISETLAEGKYGNVNEKQKEELQVILSVSRRLSSLIRDIIDIEKIKRNEIQLNLTAIDINSISTVVVEVFRHLIQSENIKIVMNIPGELSPVFADENRLKQILFNLIGNGVKFTERGTITLSAEEMEAYVKISVEDTGIGISKENQENLFQAFTQAEDEISSQYGGSGLGLYISRQLLQRMKGKIFLEWSEPKKGTRFSFLLPKAKGKSVNFNKIIELIAEEEHTITKLENKSDYCFKVLAVDDEPTNLRVLKSVLTSEGYEVLTASNGIDAIKIIKEHNDVDLVLMDVMMPGVSGYETCRKIREGYSLYDLPLLMLTARDTPEDIAAGFDAGANDFVIKPFVAKVLRARVFNLLQIKKSVQEALENEMAFLQSQIKPHFLYNAMSSIISLCYTDSSRAAELLSYLSNYLRGCFDFNNKINFVTIEKELNLIKCYVEIEKARFGEELQIEFLVDDEILHYNIVPFSIQPLVENAIRHGVMQKEDGGTVKIILKQKDNEIEICVEDNGVGMSQDTMEKILLKKKCFDKYSVNKTNTGIGVCNINDRLNRFYCEKIYLESKEGEGTKVYFKIPICYHAGGRGDA